MSTTAFVYKWVHLPSLKWYIGSRTAQGCSPDDGYVCSSKKVKPLIESAQSEWSREVIATGNPADMLELETTLLELFDAKNDLRSYNQHNGDGKFTTAGLPAHNKGKKNPHGKPSWNSGKPNPRHSAVMKGRKAPNKGVPMSEEQKLKLSVAHTGKTSPNKGNPSVRKGIPNTKASEKLKGRKQTTEWIEKRAASKRGKPNTGASIALKGRVKPKVVSRLSDRKPMTASNFV